MIGNSIKLSAVAIALLALVACQDSGTLTEVRDLENGRTLLTSADVRAVNQFKVGQGSEHGRVSPDYITCAEPSPDMAKAVASSFGMSASLDLKGIPANVQPKVAAAISRSRAESMAQLGERLATIQLLRDGLYRACEAYANGAISATTYAVMVSRYDDTMVTMLMGELAAGAFGRSLSAGGSEAEGSAEASLEAAEKRTQRLEAESLLKERKARSSEIETRLKEARTGRDRAAGRMDHASSSGADDAETEQLRSDLEQSRKQVANLEQDLERSNKNVQEAEEELKSKLAAEAAGKAKATATAAGAITPGQQSPEIARVLNTIQQKYIENINSDALAIACVSALDRDASKPATRLAMFCTTDLLPSMIREQGVLLRTVLRRRELEVTNEERRGRYKDVLQEIRELLGEADKLNTEILGGANKLEGTTEASGEKKPE